MRLAAFFAFALLVAPAAMAQQAAPQPTIAFVRPATAEEAPVARASAQLAGEAEQLRLNALAYLGLGKAREAERAVAKLVALVPGYAPHASDPAAFTALVAEAKGPEAGASPAVFVARGH